MRNQSEFYAGDAIRIQAEIRDSDGDLMTPDTSVKITVTSPDGTVEVAGTTDMTEASTGMYYYIWQSATTDAKGVYKTKVAAVDGSYTAVVEPRLFALIQ